MTTNQIKSRHQVLTFRGTTAHYQRNLPYCVLYFSITQDVGETYYVGGGLFLLVFIAIGAFVFANLVVAVVVTNLVSD